MKVLTRSRNFVDLLDPDPETILMEDIAHALSLTCRFNGMCNEFYSVAQHSVLVASRCAPENMAWGLMHDATEAYMGDIINPIKHSSELFDKLHEMEMRLMFKIAEKFGLGDSCPAEIIQVDMHVFVDEMIQLTNMQIEDFEGNEDSWMRSVAPSEVKIMPEPCGMARDNFMNMAKELGLV